MRKINNISELREERLRLRKVVSGLEEEMESDVKEIKEYLKPFHGAMNSVGSLLHRKDAWIASPGINFIIDMLVGKLIMRNAGWLSKLTVPYLLKNVTNNYVADHAGSIIESVKKLFRKFRGKNHSEFYDKTTADTNY